MTIDIVTIAWGKRYIENYFYNLIPSIINNNKIETYDFFNLNLILTYDDEDKLEIFKDIIVKNKINILYIRKNQYLIKDKYRQFNKFMEFGISKLKSKYIIPLYPDMVVSKNFLKEIYKYYLEENYDLIFLPCPRTNLDKDIFNKGDRNWNLEFNLTKFILNNCHTKMNYLTWNNKYYNNSPAWLIFNFNKAQLYYCFHMTPLLIKKSILQNKSINESFDTYISSKYLNYSYLVINNSKNICWLSYENSIIPLNQFKKKRSLLRSFIAFKKINNKEHQKLGYNSFFLSNEDKSNFLNFVDKFIVVFIKISLTIFSFFLLDKIILVLQKILLKIFRFYKTLLFKIYKTLRFFLK